MGVVQRYEVKNPLGMDQAPQLAQSPRSGGFLEQLGLAKQSGFRRKAITSIYKEVYPPASNPPFGISPTSYNRPSTASLGKKALVS
jgi:hypothetical protein